MSASQLGSLIVWKGTLDLMGVSRKKAGKGQEETYIFLDLTVHPSPFAYKGYKATSNKFVDRKAFPVSNDFYQFLLRSGAYRNHQAAPYGYLVEQFLWKPRSTSPHHNGVEGSFIRTSKDFTCG